MSTFLESVARSIEGKFGEALPQYQLVFASRRAQIYFNKILPQAKTSTIDSWLLSHLSEIKIPSRFELLVSLFEVSKGKITGDDFQNFYDFGAMLLSDFDTIDRYMVDAEKLYDNLSDHKDLDKLFESDDPTKQVAMEFLQSFDKEGAGRVMEESFIEVWRYLRGIYRGFNDRLIEQGCAYSGMAYRMVAEGFKKEGYAQGCQHTIFIGLNALSSCEREIFKSLQSAKKATFYWDYDPEWLNNTCVEAGYFIKKNLEDFPQSEGDMGLMDAGEVDVEVIPVPLETMQCKVVGELLQKSIESGENLDKTAIILTDENLLFPLLSSLPEGIGNLNISMGYPLVASKAGELAELLVQVFRAKKLEDSNLATLERNSVFALLSHPYINKIEVVETLKKQKELYLNSSDIIECCNLPELEHLWKINSNSIHSLQDYIITSATAIQKLVAEQEKEHKLMELLLEVLESIKPIINTHKTYLTTPLYLKLLRQSIREKRLDFQGVSGSGLQIIGILESRALDFERVIILSMCEDNFPASKPDKSYIPQRLLCGFGMPNQKERTAIWSYYFYRLLLRSKKVELMYCDVADGLTTGEPSRYILQLKYAGQYNPKTTRLKLPALPKNINNNIEIPKKPEIIDKLHKIEYSPSSLGMYLKCPLSFYFSKVKEIKPTESFEGEITPMDKGNIVHKTLEELYNDLLDTEVFSKKIQLIDNSKIKVSVQNNFQKIIKINVEPRAKEIALKEIERLVNNIIEYDKVVEGRARVFELEKERYLSLKNEAGVEFKIKGYVDRIDLQKDGSLCIIDYKTGSISSFEVKDIFKVFGQNSDDSPLDISKNRQINKEIMQLLIYCLVMYRKEKKDTIPLIYTPRTMGSKNPPVPIYIDKMQKDGKLSVETYNDIEQGLLALLNEICNPEIPFTQVYSTNEFGNCTYCNYLNICKKRG